MKTKTMDRKIKVLALISIVVAAAFGTVMVLATQAIAKADTPSLASTVDTASAFVNKRHKQ